MYFISDFQNDLFAIEAKNRKERWGAFWQSLLSTVL
jgi:hypothetical protein